MMDQALQLFSFLILAFLGVVAPILVVLLSMFREGMLKLSSQYKSERTQSKKNIKQQLEQLGKAEETDEKTDEKAIKASLKKLKIIRRTAKTKLSYLNPKMQILRLFLPLLISFLGVIVATLVKDNTYYVSLSIAVSIISFAYVMVALWTLLGVLVEVKESIGDDRKNMNNRMIELLSALVEKGEADSQYYLKNVYITVNDALIKNDNNPIEIEVNKKQELRVGISNSETKMAKNVEIGFTFPPDFIIEKGSHFSTYTDETSQIIRYDVRLIHGKTNLRRMPLTITSLREGDYKIETFIKAENIEATYHDLNLKVIKSSSVNNLE